MALSRTEPWSGGPRSPEPFQWVNTQQRYHVSNSDLRLYVYCTTHTITSCSKSSGKAHCVIKLVRVLIFPNGPSALRSACSGTSSFVAYFSFHTISFSLFNNTSQSARFACADGVSGVIWRCSYILKLTGSITLHSIRNMAIVGGDDICY
jgi:hypothetical protein